MLPNVRDSLFVYQGCMHIACMVRLMPHLVSMLEEGGVDAYVYIGWFRTFTKIKA